MSKPPPLEPLSDVVLAPEAAPRRLWRTLRLALLTMAGAAGLGMAVAVAVTEPVSFMIFVGAMVLVVGWTLCELSARRRR